MEIGDYYNPYGMFDGSFIPNWLMKSKISAGAKLCFARLYKYAGKDGRCFPKQETLAKELGVTRFQVSKYLKELIKYKLIKSIRKGLGKPNHYAFCWCKPCADSLLLDVTDTSHLDVTHTSHPSTKEKKLKNIVGDKKTISNKKNFLLSGKLNNIPDLNQFDVNCVKRLYKNLQKKRKIMRKPNFNNWAIDFQKLREVANQERIKETLSWYVKHIGNPFAPQAFSAGSFCGRFIDIESAMQRDNKKKGIISDDELYNNEEIPDDEDFLYNDE